MNKFSVVMHHKCATQLVRLFLEDVCTLNKLTLFHSHLSTQLPSPEHDFSLLTNADYSKLAKGDPGACVHIFRNPLSIVASAYYSHLHSHPLEHWPRLKEQRALLAGLPKEQGMWATLSFLESRDFGLNIIAPLTGLSRWDFDDDRFEPVKMEDMSRDIVATLSPRIEARLGRAITRPDPAKFAFAALSRGRQQGETDAKSHYRSGTTDSWKLDLPADLVNHILERYEEVFRRFYPEVYGMVP